jgi:uncharacterized tellurite resistance protein B-like protein
MNHDQTLLLAKLLVGIAWADMDIHPLERETVEYLLNDCNDISHDDRMAIRLYYEYPLSESELDVLLKRLQQSFEDDQSIKSAISWVKRIIVADGFIDDSERLIYDSILQSLRSPEREDRTKGLTKFLTRNLTKGFTGSPMEPLIGQGRERHLDDYLNNPLYFKVYQAMVSGEGDIAKLDYDKDILRKICLAVTLVVRIVQADDDVTQEELEESVSMLNSWMSIPPEDAKILIEKALELDISLINVRRLCRGFCGRITITERKQFLEILLSVANADGDMPRSEINRILEIAENFQLLGSTLSKLKTVFAEMIQVED